MENYLLATERKLDIHGRLVLPPLYKQALGVIKGNKDKEKHFVSIEFDNEIQAIRLTNAEFDSSQTFVTKRSFDKSGRLMLPPIFKQRLGIERTGNAVLRIVLNTITKEIFITNPHKDEV